MAIEAFINCFDLLHLTLSYLDRDKWCLAECAQVSTSFFQAASRLLYARVVYVKPGTSEFCGIEPPAQILSAATPTYAPYVQALVVQGDIFGAAVQGTLKHLKDCLGTFLHLQSLALLARLYTRDIADIASTIHNLHNLKELTVGLDFLHILTAAIPAISGGKELPKRLSTTLETLVEEAEEGEEEEEVVAEEQTEGSASTWAVASKTDLPLYRLESLTIASPSRALLDGFPEWLSELAATLRALHFQANCGSITPGVLTGLVSHLSNVTTFSLGLSYSLTDATVFGALSSLPALREVELVYYLQLNSPARFPPLRNLRKFTVRHPRAYNKGYALHFATWVRKAVAQGKLEMLRLICLDDNEESERRDGDDVPTVSNNHLYLVAENHSVDGLVSHLVAKHADSLRILDLGTATYVSKRSVSQLCNALLKLERLCICLGTGGLLAFRDHVPRMSNLRSAALLIKNLRAHYLLEPQRDLAQEHRADYLLEGSVLYSRHGADTECLPVASVAQDILKAGQYGLLRQLSLNQLLWEAMYVSGREGDTKLHVAEPRYLGE